MVTWILCPNLWGARLFCYDTADDGGGIRFLREFPRPKVQTKREDFRDDEDLEELTDPIEDPETERRVAEAFSREISQRLEQAYAQGRFNALIVCAEQHFLDILLCCLSKPVRAKVAGTVAVDLYEVNETDLASYVEDILQKQKRVQSGAA